jgi:hypothetical protein
MLGRTARWLPLSINLLVLAAISVAAGGGCLKPGAPGRTYYDSHIQPILTDFCVGGTSPCHRVDETGVALGNLDLSSFEAVQKRPDVLRRFGSYPYPLLLLKSVPEKSVLIPYRGTFQESEIRHSGGKPISVASDAFFELARWLDNGATRYGLPPPDAPKAGEGPCSTAIPSRPGDPPIDTASPLFQQFLTDVEPGLEKSCLAGTCHGSIRSDFYLTCGTDDAQRWFNFLQARGFVVDAPTAVEQSELLLRPLAASAGGVGHTGGTFFASKSDPDWQAWRGWAEAAQQSPLVASKSPGRSFFEANVMPVLLRRGCMLEACHSPEGPNDLRLHAGAQGFFSATALDRNYRELLDDFLALDTPDVRLSRVARKGIVRADGGITHRAGALLETPGHAAGEPCPSAYDPATATALCTLAEWHRIERADHGADVPTLAPGEAVPVAFVSRPPNPDSLLEFDTFRGGADLRLADAHIGAGGRVDAVDGSRSALGPCAGLAGRTDLDVRGPEWSYDATKLVFAARAGAADGLNLWLLDVAAGTCRRLTSDGGTMAGPVRVHNFDPVFAPNGALLFASTRAGTLTLKTRLPGSNLYRVGAELDFSAVEQMTWLLNSELSPAFMQDGRVIFTAEKASPDFYQVSGRRIGWDLTDYHPLLAQRAVSDDTFGNMHPSIGYQQATEIREHVDRNFLVILSDAGARGGGGALATFNRSVGPFEAGRSDPSYLTSLTIVDPTVTGRAGTAGVYRSPFPLPNGEILASYAAAVTDPSVDTPRFDLVAVDDHGGARRTLVAGGGASLVEPALGIKRAERKLYTNSAQLVFGGTTGDGTPPERAVAHFIDLPMVATLLNANLRRGRNVAAFDGTASLRVYEERPPPTAAPDPARLLGPEGVYVDRVLLGSAPLQADHSLRVDLPSRTPLILELVDGKGGTIFTTREEHQFGPGENITLAVPRRFFNSVCGGCHGSISGREIDIATDVDALTGASVSLARTQPPAELR